MSNLRYRVLVILALTLASVWALWPRQAIDRVLDRKTGAWTYDTVTRIPLKRGLDLQGGMHLALEVDESKGRVTDKKIALENALKVIRNRIDEFGVAEPVVQQVGEDRIIVELPGIDDPERATAIVEKSAFLEFQITDESGALEKALPRIDAVLRQKGVIVAGSAAAADTQGGRGVGGLFTPGADSGKAGADSSTRDSLPLAQGGPFSGVLQQGQMPGQFLVAMKDVPRLMQYLSMPEVQAVLPPGKVVRWQADSVSYGDQWYRALYVLDARPIITGDVLVDAQPATDPIEGTLVTFQLNNEGGRRFRNETGRHIKDYMAIVLDERVMGTPPVIQSAIGTRGQITMGGKGVQAAQDLALVLRAGALPVPLKVVEARNIGASLGDDAIKAGIRAGTIAIVLVILIMVTYYRFSGMLAIVGLMFYTLTTLAVLAGFDAVLTLPGLAGFVLSIGMAVDANFLVFERIREELDRGKTVRTAINEGFQHAWSAIVDTHVTTALTAVILYQFGTGPVRGFAVSLLAGLAASLVSAIFVVKTLFLAWLHRTRATQTLSI